MSDFTSVVGSDRLGVSPFKKSDATNWELVLFGRGHNVADSELALVQQAQTAQQSRAWAELAGDGLITPLVFGSRTRLAGTVPIVRLHDGSTAMRAIINGELLEVRSATDSAVLDIPLNDEPPTARTDLIYLELSYVEVRPDVPSLASSTVSKLVRNRGNAGNATGLTNDLVHPLIGTETTRRIQRQYAIKVANNATSLVGLATGAYAYSAGTRPGEFIQGDGSAAAVTALGTCDGIRRSIPLATVTTSASGLTVAATDFASQARIAQMTDAVLLDGFSASQTPTASTIMVLDNTAKVPVSAMPASPPLGTNGFDAGSVDGFAASSTPTAKLLLPLNASVKYPVSVLRTGSGQGLDSDTVDAIHASATPVLNKLLALTSLKKYPNSVWLTGTGNGIDGDLLDALHAATTPVANKLVALDGSVKYPVSTLKTGTGQGLDADTVDGFHGTPIPVVSGLLALDASKHFPSSVLYTGSGNGLDVDKIDGLHAASAATAGYLFPLDASVKLPNSVLRTGSGQGLDSDTVDTINASATPVANKIMALDATAKFTNAVWHTGSGNGLDSDLVDGQHAAAFAVPAHAAPTYTVVVSHSFDGTAPRTVNGQNGLTVAQMLTLNLGAQAHFDFIAVVSIVLRVVNTDPGTDPYPVLNVYISDRSSLGVDSNILRVAQEWGLNNQLTQTITAVVCGTRDKLTGVSTDLTATISLAAPSGEVISTNQTWTITRLGATVLCYY